MLVRSGWTHMSTARFSAASGASGAAGVPLFISYRRDDTAGYARALHDLLAREFGAERVFIDVDDIAAGEPFDQAIARAAGGAAVLLVLIGPRWLAPQPGGVPRLHDPQDFVHREVATGLASGARVIPLLVDGAAMPAAADLPPALQALATRQALVLDARRFAADTAQLLDWVRPVMGAPRAAPASAARPWPRAGMALAAVAAVLVAALVAGALLGWWPGRGAAGPAAAQAPATAASQAPQALQRPAINGRWEAEVHYDWPGAQFREQLVLQGEGTALAGTVSFLRVPRGIEQGRVDAQGLQFITRSTEQLGAGERTVTHRYSGRLDGAVLRLTMQTEGAAQPHAPVDVHARRLAPP